MSKQLYEEALADVKKVKEIAEDNAKRAILEAVTPRIRDLIERELLREDNNEEEDEDLTFAAPGAPEPEGELMTDDDMVVTSGNVATPDAEGKVVLDLSSLAGNMMPVASSISVEPPMMGSPLPEEEYEINLESIKALEPVLSNAKTNTTRKLDRAIESLDRAFSSLKNEIKVGLCESSEQFNEIAKMISRVEDTYEYVQESITDPAKKSLYEIKLESLFKDLNQLQESTMSKQSKKQMNEEDVTLKLTGLPDDIDLDSVGVDLITGEDEEGEEGGEELSDEEPSDEEGGEEMDFGDLDLGAPDEEEGMGEGEELSDDTVVEIDENMLRREITRMKRLREEAPSAAVLDDFGGGDDDGDPLLDHEPTTAGKVGEPLGESEEDVVDELGNRRKGEEQGKKVADGHESMSESLRRRLAFETRLQSRAKTRAHALKEAAYKARANGDSRRESRIKNEYTLVARRFNESVDRSAKLSRLIAESAAKLNGKNRSNNGSSRQLAESEAVESLRRKLAETNLYNAKLLYTTKLLQNESLSARQKAQVIEQLESAKTLREVKLVYESLANTLAGTSRPVNENKDRKVLGSSSRATRSASTQTLNEGSEAERWARLAGIVK